MAAASNWLVDGGRLTSWQTVRMCCFLPEQGERPLLMTCTHACVCVAAAGSASPERSWPSALGNLAVVPLGLGGQQLVSGKTHLKFIDIVTASLLAC